MPANGRKSCMKVRLFEGRYFSSQGTGAFGRTYDVSPDGQRFLMIKPAGRKWKEPHGEEHRRRTEPGRGAEAARAGELM